MSSGLNYSRWDDIGSSESEEESVISENEDSFPSEIANIAEQLVSSKLSGGKHDCQFIKLHPKDDGKGLPKVFYQHPDEFKRNVSPRDGVIESWGLFPYIPPGEQGEGYQDFGHMEVMMRKMSTHFLYFPEPGKKPTLKRPEDQFVDRLIENKVSKLKGLDLKDHLKRDYRLRIAMDDIPNADGSDRIWRTFRVSGGLKLGVFADKVIRPVMGWTRNLHAHVFTDFKDGALFGPADCRSVDMMHLDLMGFGYVPEEKWTIAHLLLAVGDKIGWVYDFGDKFYHRITVEEIYGLDQSTGAVVVIEGSGACPRENGSGNSIWKENIENLHNGSRRQREETLDKVFASPNYTERPWILRRTFDVDHFDLGRTRAGVMEALASKNSLARGAKSFVIPIHPDGLQGTTRSSTLKRHETVVKNYNPKDPHGFFEEIVSDKRDNQKKTACANCGNPNDLKLCVRCRQTWYCSVVCQRTHWRMKHKEECKETKRT